MKETASSASVQDLAYLEQFYAERRPDLAAVPAEWRNYFEEVGDGGRVRLGPSFKPRSVFNPAAPTKAERVPFSLDPRTTSLSKRVYQLVHNHRVRGHIIADVSPLGRKPPCPPELQPDFYGFTGSDLDVPFWTRP
jgi:2-oxoglutarate dehydrogenase E1 component